MKCRDCPYGIEDFERRMYWYNKIVEERGVPNDIYHDLQPEDVTDEFERFLWCDKVGGKVYCFGHCTDFYEDSDVIKQKNSSKKKSIKEISELPDVSEGLEHNIKKHKSLSKQKRRNKRERDLKHKEHLKRLDKISRGYTSPVYYTDEIYVRGYGYVKNPKPYYKRLYRGKRSKYLKKQSHKKIRRYKGELHNGGQCHKLYDFWWEYC